MASVAMWHLARPYRPSVNKPLHFFFFLPVAQQGPHLSALTVAILVVSRWLEAEARFLRTHITSAFFSGMVVVSTDRQCSIRYSESAELVFGYDLVRHSVTVHTIPGR